MSSHKQPQATHVTSRTTCRPPATDGWLSSAAGEAMSVGMALGQSGIRENSRAQRVRCAHRRVAVQNVVRKRKRSTSATVACRVHVRAPQHVQRLGNQLGLFRFEVTDEHDSSTPSKSIRCRASGYCGCGRPVPDVEPGPRQSAPASPAFGPTTENWRGEVGRLRPPLLPRRTERDRKWTCWNDVR